MSGVQEAAVLVRAAAVWAYQEIQEPILGNASVSTPEISSAATWDVHATTLTHSVSVVVQKHPACVGLAAIPTRQRP